MRRYYIPTPKPLVDQFDLSAAAIVQDVADMHALFQDVIDQMSSLDEVALAVENLDYVADLLEENFYCKEAIESLNYHGTLTRITASASEDITPYVAQEAAMEKIKEGFKKFAEYVKQVWEKVKAFFAKLFNTTAHQAKVLVEESKGHLNFEANVSTITADQYTKLGKAVEEVVTFGINNAPKKLRNVSDFEALRSGVSKLVDSNKEALTLQDGKLGMNEEFVKPTTSTLANAKWNPSNVVDLCKKFIDLNGKTSRLGEIGKRMANGIVSAVTFIPGSVQKTNMLTGETKNATKDERAEIRYAFQTNTRAYVTTAKIARVLGRQVNVFFKNKAAAPAAGQQQNAANK